MKKPFLVCLVFVVGFLRAQDTVSYLGVGTVELTAEERAALSLPEGIGLKVDFLVPGAPAEAMLEMDDVLHKLEDQWLVNPEQLAVLVRLRKPGEKVRLSVLRGGEAREVGIVLGERKREDVSAVASPVASTEVPLQGGLVLGGNVAQQEVLRQLIEARNQQGDVVMQPNVLRMQMGGGMGDVPAGGRVSRRIQFIENGQNVTFHQADGKIRIRALRDGKVEFEGDANTPEERGKIPVELRRQLIQRELLPDDPVNVP